MELTRTTDPAAPQAEQLTETGNGPTVPDEEALLRAEFGDPNQAGVYGAPTTDGGAA